MWPGGGTGAQAMYFQLMVDLLYLLRPQLPITFIATILLTLLPELYKVTAG